MKLTSAEANKLLRKLHEEHNALTGKEDLARTFTAATVENPEDARPEYDYGQMQAQIAEVETQIRTLKHALNLFNVSQELPGVGMTIDQALVYIPQLTQRRRKLSAMRAIPAKMRNDHYNGSNLIEYTYANYDLEQANADYLAATDELAKVQNALDLVNSTVQFEVEL